MLYKNPASPQTTWSINSRLLIGCTALCTELPGSSDVIREADLKSVRSAAAVATLYGWMVWICRVMWVGGCVCWVYINCRHASVQYQKWLDKVRWGRDTAESRVRSTIAVSWERKQQTSHIQIYLLYLHIPTVLTYQVGWVAEEADTKFCYSIQLIYTLAVLHLYL